MCIKKDLENGDIDSILHTIKKNNKEIAANRKAISAEFKNATLKMDENVGLLKGLSDTLTKIKP